MKEGCLAGVIISLLTLWTGMSGAAEVVSPRQFLELQVAYDLGDLFPDAATQVLVDSGYVADNDPTQNIAAVLGQDMGEVVSSKLQAGGYDFFVIQGAPVADGPWVPVASEQALAGDHAVPVSGHACYRLIAVEPDGSEVFHGLAVDAEAVPVPVRQRPTVAFLRAEIRERRRAIEASGALRSGRTTGRTVLTRKAVLLK